MGYFTLHDGEHLLIQKAAGEPIIVVRRKLTRPTAETIRSFAATIQKALARLDRPRHAVLVDLRAAPLRAGVEFDAALDSFRAEVSRDAVALARLVATSVGALQVQRLDAVDRRPTRSFSDEEEALAWLRAEVAAGRRDRQR